MKILKTDVDVYGIKNKMIESYNIATKGCHMCPCCKTTKVTPSVVTIRGDKPPVEITGDFGGEYHRAHNRYECLKCGAVWESDDFYYKYYDKCIDYTIPLDTKRL